MYENMNQMGRALMDADERLKKLEERVKEAVAGDAEHNYTHGAIHERLNKLEEAIAQLGGQATAAEKPAKAKAKAQKRGGQRASEL